MALNATCSRAGACQSPPWLTVASTRLVSGQIRHFVAGSNSAATTQPQRPRLSDLSFSNTLKQVNETQTPSDGPASRAKALSRLLNLISSQDPVEAAEIHRAYRAVIDVKPTELSPHVIRQLIAKLNQTSTESAFESFVLVKSILTDASARSFELKDSCPTEARQWFDLLRHGTSQLALLHLLAKSFAKASDSELKTLSTLSPAMTTIHPGYYLPTWNAMLGLLVASPEWSTEGSLDGERRRGSDDDECFFKTPLPDLNLGFSSPVAYTAGLLTQGEHQISLRSLRVAHHLFDHIWRALKSLPRRRNRPNARSYLHRIAMECKVAHAEIIDPLLVVDAAEIRSQGFSGQQDSGKGWRRVQRATQDAYASKKLHHSHVSKIAHEASKVQARIREALTKADPSLSSQEQDHLAERLLGTDSKLVSDSAMWELFEAMRYNSVQQEMEKLRPAASGDENLTKDAPTEAASLRLLGTPLPRSVIPNKVDFDIFIRHFACVSSDYAATMNIAEDCRTFFDNNAEHTSDEPARPTSMLDISTLCLVIRGFALHGVPFRHQPVEHSEEPDLLRDCEGWKPAEDRLAQDHPKIKWNICNLMPFVRELLAKPDAILAGHENLKLAVGANGRGGTVSGNYAHRREGSARPAAAYRKRKLMPVLPSDDFFFLLLALRRCTGDEYDDEVLKVVRQVLQNFGPTGVRKSPRLDRLVTFLDARSRQAGRADASTLEMWAQVEGRKEAEL